MPLTYDEILTTANAGELLARNAKFLAKIDEPTRQLMIDNIVLDLYGQRLDDENGFAKSPARVYEAAKLIFARLPGKTFTYDATSAWDEFGSPWGCDMAEPETWLVCYARRTLENDECCIGGPITDGLVADACDLVRTLMELGLAPEAVQDNLDFLTYGRYVLENSVRDDFGWVRIEPDADQLEVERDETEQETA